jgi:hypothetical protein
VQSIDRSAPTLITDEPGRVDVTRAGCLVLDLDPSSRHDDTNAVVLIDVAMASCRTSRGLHGSRVRQLHYGSNAPDSAGDAAPNVILTESDYVTGLLKNEQLTVLNPPVHGHTTSAVRVFMNGRFGARACLLGNFEHVRVEDDIVAGKDRPRNELKIVGNVDMLLADVTFGSGTLEGEAGDVFSLARLDVGRALIRSSVSLDSDHWRGQIIYAARGATPNVYDSPSFGAAPAPLELRGGPWVTHAVGGRAWRMGLKADFADAVDRRFRQSPQAYAHEVPVDLSKRVPEEDPDETPTAGDDTLRRAARGVGLDLDDADGSPGPLRRTGRTGPTGRRSRYGGTGASNGRGLGIEPIELPGPHDAGNSPGDVPGAADGPSPA